MPTRKIGIIGAGQIGGQLAMFVAQRQLANVILLDVPQREGLAKGKALDIMQAAAVLGTDAEVKGTCDYTDLAGSDLVVVTAGKPRSPGQSRDDLLRTNLGIIRDVALQISRHCPGAFCIIVTNPLDAMAYAFQKLSGMEHHMVVGMAGVLDTGRFCHFVRSQLGISVKDISAMILGGHGPTMVPVTMTATAGGVLLECLMTDQQIQEVVAQTRMAGDQIVQLLGNGSAFFSPAASILQMAEAYLLDNKRLLPAAAYLDGQYGLSGIYVGVPVVIGAGGVERIVEIPLDDQKRTEFLRSCQAVKQLIEQVDSMIEESA